MAHFDPYGLLGVTCDSSLNDIRKAYYRLALLIHPDKGGNVEDMYILESSYKWITEKHKAVIENGGDKSVEDIEKEFENFIIEQESHKLPSLDSIFVATIGFDYDTFMTKVWFTIDEAKTKTILPAAAYEIILFHFKTKSLISQLTADADEIINVATKFLEDLLNKDSSSEFSSASIQHGYGDDMIKDETAEVRAFTKDEIVVYTEPESFFKPNNNYGANIDTSTLNKLDDYTSKTKELYMTDYKQAFKEIDEKGDYDELFGDNKSLEVLLAAKELERI